MLTDQSILVGRPHGGLGILWRKSLGDSIQVHKYLQESQRVMAVKFEYDNQKVLILNVYMPYDDRSHGENYECFFISSWANTFFDSG